MAKPMTQKPKVGDRVTLIGNPRDMADITKGKEYEIIGFDDDGDPYFLDDVGVPEYITPVRYGNYSVTAFDDTDPGFIAIDVRRPMDNTGTALLEVTVDAKGHETLNKLAAQHEKATAKAEILAQIKALQDQLDKL